MANVAHSSLTGTNLHENKGVAAATAGQVATADGSGNTVWAKLTATNLTGTGNSFGAQLLHLQYYTIWNNAPNNFGTASTWVKTHYNVAGPTTNEISGATFSSDVISLPAGTYFILSLHGGANQQRLRNTTAGTTLLSGFTSGEFMSGRFTLAGTSNIEIQGWGVSNYPTIQNNGENGVVTDCKIWKIS